MNGAHEEYLELAAGYALHALEPDEEQQFEEHLRDCGQCQDEVALHRETLADLALSIEARPARGLRDALMDSIRADSSPDVVTPLRAARPRASWLLAAAASVAAVTMAGVALTSRSDVRDARAELAASRQVLACIAPACTASWLASPDKSRYGVVLDRGSSAELVVDSLDRNDASKEQYVLWRQDPKGRMSAVRGFDASGKLMAVSVTGLNRPYTGFAISREAGRRLPATPSTPLLLPVATV